MSSGKKERYHCCTRTRRQCATVKTVSASVFHETYRILEKLFRILYIISGDLICEFRKYQQRLREKGMTVPPCIEELIWQYLQRTEKKGRGTSPLP